MHAVNDTPEKVAAWLKKQADDAPETVKNDFRAARAKGVRGHVWVLFNEYTTPEFNKYRIHPGIWAFEGGIFRESNDRFDTGIEFVKEQSAEDYLAELYERHAHDEAIKIEAKISKTAATLKNMESWELSQVFARLGIVEF